MLLKKLQLLTFLTLVLTNFTSCIKQQEEECILFCNGKPHAKISTTLNVGSVPENAGTVQIYVSLSTKAQNSVSIQYDIYVPSTTAVKNSDFTLIPGVVNFSPGEQDKSFSVTIIDDFIANEGSEQVGVYLKNPYGITYDPTPFAFKILDNDFDTLTVGEGSPINSNIVNCDDGTGNPQTVTLASQSDDDANCSINGSNQVSCTPDYKNSQIDWIATINVNCVINSVNYPLQFDLNVTNQNRAPTVSAATNLTLSSPAADTPTVITYAQLESAVTDEADADGDTVTFKITSVDSGSLLVNGDAFSTANDIFSSGNLTWTPGSGSNGTVGAFTIKAYDGTLASAVSVPIFVNSVLAFTNTPAFSVAEGANGQSVALNCTDGSVSVPNWSIQNQSPNSNCVLTSPSGVSQLDCTPSYQTGHAAWQSLVTVRCNFGGQTVDKDIAVNVTDVNRLPVFTGLNKFTNGLPNTPYNITFNDLLTIADVGGGSPFITDADLDSFYFTIESVLSGTLKKNGITVVPPQNFQTGETLQWTPGIADIGTTNAFNVRVIDAAGGLSLAGQTVQVDLIGLSLIPTLNVAEGATQATAAIFCDDGAGGSVNSFTLSPGVDTNCAESTIGNSTTITCNPSFHNDQASWYEDLTLTCDIGTGPTILNKVFRVQVANTNRQPTIAAPSLLPVPLPGDSSDDVPVTVKYTDLITSVTESDSDLIKIIIDSVPANGVLKKGAAIVVPGTTSLLPGEEVIWTPNPNTVGQIEMFSISADDQTGNPNSRSAASVPVKTEISGVYTIPTLNTTELVNVQSPTINCAEPVTGNTSAVYTVDVLPVGFDAGGSEDTESNCSILSGKVSCTPQAIGGGVPWTKVVRVTCTIGGYSKDEDFTLSVNNLDLPPVLSTVDNMTGAFLNTDFNITYVQQVGSVPPNDNDLYDNVTANDPEGNPISYELMSISSGSWKIGSNPAAAGNKISNPEVATWTPPVDALGIIEAAKIRVWDGTQFSTNSMALNVEIAGMLNIVSPAQVPENSPLLAPVEVVCNDGANTAKSLLITSQGPYSNCTVNGSQQIECTPGYNPAAGNWTDTVAVQCTSGAYVNSKNFTLSVSNINRAPTMILQTPQNFITTQVNVSTPITYLDMEANFVDVTELDGDTIIYDIETINSGTLMKGATVLTTADSFQLGDTLTWIPPVDTLGGVEAFSIRANDQAGGISSPVSVYAQIEGLIDIANITITEGTTGGTAPLSCNDGNAYAIDTDFTITFESDGESNCSVLPDKTVSCSPAYKLGQSNWTSIITVQCGIGAVYTKNFTVNVTNANQAPTLTSINSTLLPQAITATPRTITYADLIAAADEADADGDTIRFSVESIGSQGTLLKNGLAIAVGTPPASLVTATDVLTWTSNPAETGNITAFSITAYDGQAESSTPVDVVLTNVAQFNTIANLAVAENSNSVTAPMVCTPGSPTYTILPTSANLVCSTTGSDEVDCAANYNTVNLTGNWNEVVTVQCTLGATNYLRSFTVNVTNTNRVPSITTPVIAFPNTLNTAGINSGELYPINVAHIIAEAGVTEPDNQTFSFDVDAIDANGTLRVNGVVASIGTNFKSSDSLTWTSNPLQEGTVANAIVLSVKDVVNSANPTQIQISMNDVALLQQVPDATQPEGTPLYTTAQFKCSDGVNAASMNITSLNIIKPAGGTEAADPSQIACASTDQGSGNFDISCNIGYADDDPTPYHNNWQAIVTYECTLNSVPYTKQFTISVSDVNQAPVLTVSTVFDPGTRNADPFASNFAALEVNTDIADPEGDGHFFKVNAVLNGTLKIKGYPYAALTNELIKSGDSWEWTPPAAPAGGDMQAFSVTAVDENLTDPKESAVPVNISVKIFQYDPIITLIASESDGPTDTPSLVCTDGVLTATDSNFSILSQTEAGDAPCTIQPDGFGSAVVRCDPNYKATHSSWSNIVQVQCTLGATSFTNSYTLQVNDINRAPTISAMADIDGAYYDENFTITYTDLFLASNATDADGDQVSFIVDSFNPTCGGGGTYVTLKKNGVDITPGVTVVGPGESIVWASDAVLAGGDCVNAIGVRAFDGIDPSVTTNVLFDIGVIQIPAKLTPSSSVIAFGNLTVSTSSILSVTLTQTGDLAAVLKQFHAPKGITIVSNTCSDTINTNVVPIPSTCVYDIKIEPRAFNSGMIFEKILIGYDDGYANIEYVELDVSAIISSTGDGTYNSNSLAGLTNLRFGGWGDVDNDGNIDFIGFRETDNYIYTLEASGGTSFNFYKRFTSAESGGCNISSLDFGDLNNDGVIDAIWSCAGANAIFAAPGNAGLTYINTSLKTNTAITATTVMTKLLDYNGDKDLDFVAINDVTGQLIFGPGNGTLAFGGSNSKATGSVPNGMAIGDFNSDGFQDVAVSNEGSKSISIFTYNNSTSQFSLFNTVSLTNAPYGLSATDYDNDGHLDLVTVDKIGKDLIVLDGNGLGAFSVTSINVDAGESNTPIKAEVGDMNGDGFSDVVIISVNPSGHFINQFFMNNGSGSLAVDASKDYTITVSPTADINNIYIEDYDNNGTLDIIFTSGSQTTSFLREGN